MPFMRVSSSLLLLACLLASSTAHADPIEAVNAVAGDRSWIEEHGQRPSTDAAEIERIQTHLRWVEGQLRAHPPALTAAAQRSRDALLDALHEYGEAGRFPQHSRVAPAGRRPRFVDDEGRHCAVAFLIRTSGHTSLVEAIQARHEYDYIADMRTPGLLAWANEHGFTPRELAMIQPTYFEGGGVHVPTEFEERMARERARREAQQPRPLTDAHLETIPRVIEGRDLLRTCLGERTGHWPVQVAIDVPATRYRVRFANVRVRVRVTREDGRRERRVEGCLRGAVRDAMRRLLASAHYTAAGALRLRATPSIHVASREEVAQLLIAQDRVWHSQPTRQETLSRCLPEPKRPRQLLIRVSSWNGQVALRFDQMGELPRDERAVMGCVHDVISYGRLSQYGTQDYDLVLQLDPDGTLRLPQLAEPVECMGEGDCLEADAG